jgi:hypothetical protein
MHWRFASSKPEGRVPRVIVKVSEQPVTVSRRKSR